MKHSYTDDNVVFWSINEGCKKLECIVEQFYRDVLGSLQYCYLQHFCETLNIVSQYAIQYGIISNRKAGAYYGNKKCKCNGSCAAGD